MQTPRIMIELCCYNFVVWACEKMGGLSPPCFQSCFQSGGGGGGGGGGSSPPYFSAPAHDNMLVLVELGNQHLAVLVAVTIDHLMY